MNQGVQGKCIATPTMNYRFELNRDLVSSLLPVCSPLLYPGERTDVLGEWTDVLTSIGTAMKHIIMV